MEFPPNLNHFSVPTSGYNNNGAAVRRDAGNSTTGQVLNMFNFGMAPPGSNNPSYGAVPVIGPLPEQQLGIPVQPPPRSTMVPLPQRHFEITRCCAERNLLFRENEMLKRELQKHHAIIARQREHMQRSKELAIHCKKRMIQEHNKMYREERETREKLEITVSEQERKLHLTSEKLNEQHQKLESMTAVEKKFQKTLKSKGDQIIELEFIMAKQQEAVELLSTKKMLARGKLAAMVNFASEVNADFEQGLKTLKRDFGLNTNKYLVKLIDHDEKTLVKYDADEQVMRQLKVNLNSLSALVHDTIEMIKSDEANCSKVPEPLTIHLKRQSRDSNGSWSVVPLETDSDGKEETEMSTEGNDANNAEEPKLPSNSPPPSPRHLTNVKSNRCSCGYQGQNKSALRIHLKYYRKKRKSPSEKTLECKLCNARFYYMATLRKHYEEFHHIVDAKKRKCTVCGIIFPTMGELEQHRYQHYYNNSAEFEKEAEMEQQQQERERSDDELHESDEVTDKQDSSSTEMLKASCEKKKLVVLVARLDSGDNNDNTKKNAPIQQQEEHSQQPNICSDAIIEKEIDGNSIGD